MADTPTLRFEYTFHECTNSLVMLCFNFSSCAAAVIQQLAERNQRRDLTPKNPVYEHMGSRL